MFHVMLCVLNIGIFSVKCTGAKIP